MKCTLNRRDLLKASGAAVAAAVTARRDLLLAANTGSAKLSTPSAAEIGWPIAMATYTFRSVSFYEALEKIAALGVQHVEPVFF